MVPNYSKEKLLQVVIKKGAPSISNMYCFCFFFFKFLFLFIYFSKYCLCINIPERLTLEVTIN